MAAADAPALGGKRGNRRHPVVQRRAEERVAQLGPVRSGGATHFGDTRLGHKLTLRPARAVTILLRTTENTYVCSPSHRRAGAGRAERLLCGDRILARGSAIVPGAAARSKRRYPRPRGG